MSLSRAHQILADKIEYHLAGVYDAGDLCIYISNGIVGDLESERLALRVSIVITKLFKVVDYLTIKVGHPSFLLKCVLQRRPPQRQ
jgi:hypothetical protein